MIPLASNENPLGMSDAARQAAVQALDNAALYPDSSGRGLKLACPGKAGRRRGRV